MGQAYGVNAIITRDDGIVWIIGQDVLSACMLI